MNWPTSLRDHYLRLDARSLGLFRVGMGAVLIGDLLQRMRFAKELYSNEGILPNHNHLFNLRETTHVWSALHAFSSPTEAQVGLLVVLFFYVGFTLGWHTRAFQALALVGLVSLGSRDILLENAGNYLATALLGFTLFLPLGSRFSVDSMRRSMRDEDEPGPRALNHRRHPSQLVLDATRAPGWTPTSIAALGVLAQIIIVYLCMALQQRGPVWSDGSALYYAMHSERWASGAGAALRSLPSGLLVVWGRVFRLIELVIPVLLLVPGVWRHARVAAAALMVFTGLTLAIPFTLGLFGWTLVAAAALVIAPESWEAFEGKPLAKRARTVIYDVDCGVCLWTCRVLKRLDLRGNLTFRGNDDLEDLPAGVTEELVASTVVVVTASGAVETKARAVAAALDALPLGFLVSWPLRVPGLSSLANVAYDAFAVRRHRVSVAMGKAACGTDASPLENREEGFPKPLQDSTEGPDTTQAAPAVKLVREVSGTFRELTALVLFAAVLSQATQVNDVGLGKLAQPKWLEAVTLWPRMMERWDVLAAPSTDDEAIVIDAQTKGGRSVDPLTGKDPVLEPQQMHGMGLGQLWTDYLFRIRSKEWSEFQRAFRDYLNKGGPRWNGEGEDVIVGYDAYLLKRPIPPPGQMQGEAVTTRDKFMTQARGGKFATGPQNVHPLEPKR